MFVAGRRSIFLLIVASVLFVVRAEGADITVYAGGVNPGNLSVNGVETALESGPIFGFRLRTSFVPHFGMEHTLGFSTDYLFPPNISAVTDAKGFVFNSNLIFDLSIGKAVPYVTAGIGLVHQYGSENLPVGTKFAVNYGGGLEFPRLLGALGLRFDARGYTATSIFSNSLNIFEVSGGVLISF